MGAGKCRSFRSLRANAASTGAAMVLALVGLAMAYPGQYPVPVRAAGILVLAGMALVALRCARAGVVVTEAGLVVRNIVDSTTIPWAEVGEIRSAPSGEITGLGRCVTIRTRAGGDVVARRLASYSPERMEHLVAQLQAGAASIGGWAGDAPPPHLAGGAPPGPTGVPLRQADP